VCEAQKLAFANLQVLFIDLYSLSGQKVRGKKVKKFSANKHLIILEFETLKIGVKWKT
jgi:hypothetical protein